MFLDLISIHCICFYCVPLSAHKKIQYSLCVSVSVNTFSFSNAHQQFSFYVIWFPIGNQRVIDTYKFQREKSTKANTIRDSLAIFIFIYKCVYFHQEYEPEKKRISKKSRRIKKINKRLLIPNARLCHMNSGSNSNAMIVRCVPCLKCLSVWCAIERSEYKLRKKIGQSSQASTWFIFISEWDQRETRVNTLNI